MTTCRCVLSRVGCRGVRRKRQLELHILWIIHTCIVQSSPEHHDDSKRAQTTETE